MAKYILMAQQETGEECRATDELFATWAEADGQIDNIMDDHPEWGGCWVEELPTSNPCSTYY